MRIVTRPFRALRRRLPASFGRNLLVLGILAGGCAALYSHHQPTVVGRDVDGANVDLRKVTADVLVPTAARAKSNSGTLNALEGRTALLMNLMLLERGIAEFSKVPDYTCTFFKRERVGGALGDGQVMVLKLRHAPFSIYLKWIRGDKGRELIYADGQNDGKMLVKVGGVKGRLLPAVNLDLDGRIAKQQARHPITDLGVVQLARRIVKRRRNDITNNTGTRCRMFDNQKVNDRDCYCFIIEYPSVRVSADYRKSVIFVDKEWLMPIYIKNFDWPSSSEQTTVAEELDEATLLEHYSFSDIRINRQLADRDFDRENERYGFRR